MEPPIHQVVERYLSGETTYAIAKSLHTWPATVASWLKPEGVVLRPKGTRNGMSPVQRDFRIVELYQANVDSKDIAQQLHVSTREVASALKGSGIQRRTKRRLLSAEQLVEGARLYRNGADYRELATKYGVSPTCVCDALRAVPGFKPRVGWAKYRTTPFCDRKGRWYRFKSSWELAYARYLDAQGKDWEYEPRSYPLVECVKYTPDFEVYEAGRLVDMVDVKGWLDDRSEARILEFKHTYPDLPFRLVGIDELVALGLIPEFYANHPMVVRQRRFQTSGVMDPAGFA